MARTLTVGFVKDSLVSSNGNDKVENKHLMILGSYYTVFGGLTVIRVICNVASILSSLHFQNIKYMHILLIPFSSGKCRSIVYCDSTTYKVSPDRHSMQWYLYNNFDNLFQSLPVNTESTSLHELKTTQGTSFQNLCKLKLQKSRNVKCEKQCIGRYM